MSDYKSAQMARLYAALTNYASPEQADLIVRCRPLANAPSPKQRFLWAEQVCAELSRRFSPDQVKQIRMNCACGPTKSTIVQLRRMVKASHSPEELVQRYNSAQFPSSMRLDGGYILFTYTECYCGYVNKIDQPLPIVWCYCTLGYAKRLFEGAFESEISIELTRSVKLGDSICEMRVRPCNYEWE